jgi:SET domain-containing protein
MHFSILSFSMSISPEKRGARGEFPPWYWDIEHSDTPNMEWQDGGLLVAIKEIEEGETLTLNYNSLPDNIRSKYKMRRQQLEDEQRQRRNGSARYSLSRRFSSMQ